VPAIADSGDGLIAWVDTTGGATATKIVARERLGGTLGAQLTLSRAGSPIVGLGLEASSSAAGNIGVGFAQGGAGPTDPRTIVAAVVDLPKAPPAGGGNAQPTISALRMSRKIFRLGKALPHLSARRLPVGTTISFSVDVASKTTFRFERASVGRRVGSRCLRNTRRRARLKRCSRYVALRPSLVYTTAAGPHRLRFTGRLSRRAKLKPGLYRLRVTAKDSGGTSKPQLLPFRVV
jgi:hypothetical protein